MDAIRAAARRHPRAVDGGLVAGLVAVTVLLVDARTPGDWVSLVAVPLPLIWRRRAPAAVFWVVLVVALLAWTVAGIDEGYPFVAIAVALGTVAERASWRQLVAAYGGAGVLLAAAGASGDLTWSGFGVLLALLVVAGLTGTQLRTRRAYLAGLEERAARLERERDQRARLAVAAERARIARETHDIVAHNLSVMVALADGAALIGKTAPQRALPTLSTISETGRQALGEMQRLVGVLREGSNEDTDDRAPERAPQPGLDDLDALVAQVRDAGPRVRLTREGTPGEWGPGAGLTVYRIVQEALTNTLEHAGPKASAHVRISCTATGVEVVVTDDGGTRPPDERPDEPTPSRPGHGLAGMAERVAAYDGRFEAGPAPDPDSGWRVRARIGFTDAAEAE